MGRALIFVEPTTAAENLLYRAGELCNDIYNKIILLRIVNRDNYTDSLQRKVRSSGNISDMNDILEEVRQQTKETAEKAFLDIDVPYEVITISGNIPEDIITEAEKQGIDHIFIVGKQRSPTGKAVFGDVAQRVILNFDGLVTITTDNDI